MSTISRVRVRQHVNPLKVEFLIPRTEAIPMVPGREVEVELGCADAQFLYERAEQAKAAGLARSAVGLEIRKEFIEPVNDLAKNLGLDVRAYFANMNVDMPYLFEDGRVARFFLNFPDPWFKKKQHKRRVVDEELVAQIHRALVPGGELFFQSDVWELALDALSNFEEFPELLENQGGPWSFWKNGNPYGVRSRREVGCEEAGEPVWRILYRKRS